MQFRPAFTFMGLLLLIGFTSLAQQKTSALTIEQIMQDPKWIGSSPSEIFWGADGETLYFNWNPNHEPDDSLYSIQLKNQTPIKVSSAERSNLVRANQLKWNEALTAYLYEKDGDIYYKHQKNNRLIQVTNTVAREQQAQFGFMDKKIVYVLQQNLYAWDIETGATTQLSNFVKESKDATDKKKPDAQAAWLEKDQLEQFSVLRERKALADIRKQYREKIGPKPLREILIGKSQLGAVQISPDGRFISYRLRQHVGTTGTLIPEYVTNSGYTNMINGRAKVGHAADKESFFMYDRIADSIYSIAVSEIPGIKEIPEFVQDYPNQLAEMKKADKERAVGFNAVQWAPNGQHVVLEIHAQDNKDRWLMLWDTASKKLSVLDRQHDEAWIGGPGIHARNTGWIDANRFWYQSEQTGYSHIYIYDVQKKIKTQLLKGAYEVQEAELSADKKYFFVTTNKTHPGEKQFYTINIANGNEERITQMEGANLVSVAPNEKYIAFIHSYSNHPPELYIQKMDGRADEIQITHKAQSNAFMAYPWRDPEIIQFVARDGKQVYARLYKPNKPVAGMPAVLFVHGAGYLQNAHKWWSSYFREFMFNNLLADQGYYVLDIDYRGSAGYGRDWRTGIYRHMGGKDLSDHVDGVAWLKKNYAVNPEKIGLYGGSYGGFITLMGLFTEPDIFSAGAALRPVTDWAQYNHGYTSNILNEPFTDSLAYRRSSPIYFAEGLRGHLLICHGMSDVNVHFQDAVKLSQRLIELRKNNWELMGYPMEDHGFKDAGSWTDEYKRIFKLFESVLK